MPSMVGKTYVYEVFYGVPAAGLAERAFMALHDGEINGTDSVGSRWYGTYEETETNVSITLHIETKIGVYNAVTCNIFPHTMEEPLRKTVARDSDGNLMPITAETPRGTIEVRFVLLRVLPASPQ